MAYYHDDFQFDDNDDLEPSVGCNSVVACAWLIFYRGVPYGDITEVMAPVNYETQGYLWRILFDISFFVWVGSNIH